MANIKGALAYYLAILWYLMISIPKANFMVETMEGKATPIETMERKVTTVETVEWKATPVETS